MMQNRFGNTSHPHHPAHAILQPNAVPAGLTMRDIARAAGVAPSTVSAVINGRWRQARISPDTADRVRQTVERLGYRPDHVARSLRRGTTGLIGLAVSWLQDPFYPELSAAFGRACRALGYGIFLTDLPNWLDSEADDSLGKSLVDGVVLVDTRRSPWHPGGKVLDPGSSALPTVMVAGQEWLLEWQLPVGGSANILALQTEQAGRLAARHLWEREFRRFAYVSQLSPARLTSGYREFGFYDELRHLGVPSSAILMTPLAEANDSRPVQDSLASYASAVALVRSGWCSGSERVGIYVVNDLAAMQVLRALHEAGLAVPQQVGVVGTNGIQLGQAAYPPLTSVSLNVEAVAAQAAARIVDLVTRRTGRTDPLQPQLYPDSPPASSNEVQPTLLIRQST